MLAFSNLLDQDISIYRQSFDINYFGTLHTVKATLTSMVKTPLAPRDPKRRVIFIASVAALAGFVGYAPYTSSKYAVRGLSDALRNELKLYDIETSIFYPGKISTPMIECDLPTKPAATSRIDSASAAVSADVTAKALVRESRMVSMRLLLIWWDSSYV